MKVKLHRSSQPHYTQSLRRNQVLIGSVFLVGLLAITLLASTQETENILETTPVSTISPTSTPSVTIIPQATNKIIIPAIKTPETNPQLDQVNRARISKGLKPVRFSNKIQAGATERAKYLYDSKVWSHEGFKEAFNKTGIRGGKIGENLAKDYATFDQVINAWVASSTHYAVMFDPVYRYGAIGTYGNITVLWLSEAL